MAFVTYAEAQYHVQDFDTFCGPATTLMMLTALTPSAAPSSEEDLRAIIAETDDSNATPRGVADAITGKQPVGSNTKFAPKPLSNFDQANDLIVRALYDTRKPVPVEYLHGFHWILVTGALTSIEPVAGTRYTVLGFFIHNPVVQPKQGKLVHLNHDKCGREAFFGFLEEFVSIADWRQHFGNGDGTFVSISIDAVSNGSGASTAMPGSSFASAGTPQQQAVNAISAHQLALRGPLQPYLNGATPGGTFDVTGRTFRIRFVTMMRNAAIVGYVRFAALDGTFLGAVVSEPGKLHSLLAPEQMRAALLDELRLTLGFDGSDQSSISIVVEAPFWRPCREAVTPYYSLYPVTTTTPTGARRQFATADGALHDSLTFYDVRDDK